ncbi:MAG TPA: hypothetical protein VN493_12205 [Thermoanaerobaculia bacterium]|nr:hypothetical protein [Thermoanaerobaculia bacterium]
MKVLVGHGSPVVPEDIKDLPSTEKVNEVVYEVPWGYYAGFTSSVPMKLGTDSLNSCFAYISSYKQGRKVFFAHVFSDGEADHIVKMLTDPDAEDLKCLACVAVVGVNPKPTTRKRIQAIISRARVPHVVVRASTGAVTFTPSTGEVECVKSIKTAEMPTRRSRIEAMGKSTASPLIKMHDSEDFEL